MENERLEKKNSKNCVSTEDYKGRRQNLEREEEVELNGQSER